MANIELPKDADGNEVPLDTTTLYEADGTPCDVSHFEYCPRCKIPEDSWKIVVSGTDFYKRVSNLYLAPPDSLKQLAEDLNRFVKNWTSNPHNPMPCIMTGYMPAFLI